MSADADGLFARARATAPGVEAPVDGASSREPRRVDRGDLVRREGARSAAVRRFSLQFHRPETPRGEEASGATSVFLMDPEPRSAVLWRRVLRVLVGLMALVIVARGISSLVQGPPKAPAAPSLPASVTFPTSQAEGIASRWASAYLALSPAQSTTRSAVMALDTPAGSASEGGGWNGQGAVTVRNVYPAGIQVADSTRAVVTVLAQITNGKSPVQWIGVAVPVRTEGARVLVDGTGAAFASLPGEGSASPSTLNGPQCRIGFSTCTPDAELTAQTKAGGAAFFAAYAGADAGALSQATAPGVNLAPLGGTVQPLGVSDWTVYQGSGDTRPATATVTWRLGAAQIQQRYRLTLTQVSAAGSTSWRVAGITAG